MLMAKTNFNYKNEDVANFRLISGEEFIAQVIEDRTETYILLCPMMLVKKDGEFGLIGNPVAIDFEAPIVLNKHAVAFHAMCQSEFATQYLEKVASMHNK